jgi:hypothetical protein
MLSGTAKGVIPYYTAVVKQRNGNTVRGIRL